MTRVRPLALLLMLALAPLPLAAQESEMVGDRPDFTESALSVPSGRIQLEAGLTFSDFDIEDHQLDPGCFRQIVLYRRPDYVGLEGIRVVLV